MNLFGQMDVSSRRHRHLFIYFHFATLHQLQKIQDYQIKERKEKIKRQGNLNKTGFGARIRIRFPHKLQETKYHENANRARVNLTLKTQYFAITNSF